VGILMAENWNTQLDHGLLNYCKGLVIDPISKRYIYKHFRLQRTRKEREKKLFLQEL